MRNQTIVASLVLLVLALAARGEEDEPVLLVKPKPVPVISPSTEPAVQPFPQKTRFGPMDVEVRLSDGSALRGELKNVESVKLKTGYGMLNFPTARILRIARGQRLTPEEAKQFEETLKLLDSDNYQRRAAGQQKLEDMGPAVIASLKQARASSSVEARNRIDAVIKKIESKGLPRQQPDDVVQAEDFSAIGRLEMASFLLKSKLGELNVKFEDIESMRWLSRGSSNAFEMEAGAGLEEWQDSGVDAVMGMAIAIQCSGQISINEQNTPASGNPNWGNGNPFMTGAIVGKFGSAGQSFLIGNGKRWPAADSGERLYIKIFWPGRFSKTDTRCNGKFAIRVATGAWADELPANLGNDN